MINVSFEVPWVFLLIAGFAGYFQTVTGFGLGMLVMGLVGGMGVLPMTSVVAVISLMTLVNCAIALPGRLHFVNWPTVLAVLLGLLPSLVLGVWLLNYLSVSASVAMQMLLGVVIVYGGLALLIKPRYQQKISSPRSFTLFSSVSGLFGGLFEIAGPPLIYHYYRQPLAINCIRHTLLLLFGLASGARTGLVISTGQMTTDIVLLTAWALPAVVIGTWLGRRWAPPLSVQAMRRLVCLVLLLIGLSLIIAGVSQQMLDS